MNFKQVFKDFDKLSSFEQFILKTCTYLPPKEKTETSNLHKYHPLEWYANNYMNAFGSEFEAEIKGKDVLDFGCGFGGYVIAMAQMGAKSVTGVEIQSHVQQGVKKAEEMGLNNVSFIHGSSLSLPDNSFDLITSHDAFEHFEDPEQVLAEMIRLVKPGGLVLVKFGPTWLSPWGKHMNGTFRKDRPWMHVFLSEKVIMRVHSVYHNGSEILEHYAQRPGGLNQMTVKRAKKIASKAKGSDLNKFETHMMFKWSWLKFIPVLNELFSSWVYFSLRKRG